MPAKKHFVKYYDGILPNWKGYEEFTTATGPYRVVFEQTAKGFIASDVPEDIAARLHKSDAYDIIDEKGAVPSEFAAGASPYGKPKPPTQSAPVSPSDAERKLADENEQLKAQLAALQLAQRTPPPPPMPVKPAAK